MVTYLSIFLFKIIEDSLATLRLIVVSSGKKVFGAVLQFICTVIWVLLAGTVLVNFTQDYFKIIAFSLGALIGSYVGSFLEEKLAFGVNGYIIKSKENSSLLKYFNDLYPILILNDAFMVIVSRRKEKEVIDFVKKTDKSALIICERVKIF